MSNWCVCIWFTFDHWWWKNFVHVLSCWEKLVHKKLLNLHVDENLIYYIEPSTTKTILNLSKITFIFMYILELILERSSILRAWSIRHTYLHQFLCLPANQLNPSTPRPTLTQYWYKNTILRNSDNPVYKNILFNTKDSIRQNNIYFDIKDSTQHKNYLIRHKRLNSTQKIFD